MSDIEKTRDDAAECWAGAAIGAKAGTKGFKMLVDSSKSCKVNVLTTVHGKPIPVVRFDAAHAGFNVPHINVNPKVNTKLTADPHLPIPFGEAGLQVSPCSFSVLS